MTPLLELRAAQDLRTFAVDVTDVYDEFSFGVFDPTAIRDFIRYAYESWQPPAPTFVVLVGDANQDYLDHLGTGTPNFLPTHLFETNHHGQSPGDNFYAAVSGDDILPDVFIGRIAVRTPAQADAVVAKIVSYEANVPGSVWNRAVLLVADSEPGFAAAQDALAASFLPPTYTTSRVYLDDFPSTEAARAALFAEIDQGAVVASYLGHGSVRDWAREKLLTSADVSSFANHGRYPFVTTLDCINGHYPHPLIPFSLAETLLVAPRWRISRCGGCARKVWRRHDRTWRSWRHLDCLGQLTYLRYAIWRVRCPRCGVRTEQVPWAQVGSRFTRAFEQQVAWMAQRCDLTATAEYFRISWATVRSIVHRVVEIEWNGDRRLDGLRVIGMDEISYRRHHKYLTVVVDHLSGQVVWAGKDCKVKTLLRFFRRLGPERAAQLEAISADMWEPYLMVLLARS